MPLHDFFCARCLHTVETYRPVTVRATADPPTHCGEPMQWVPKVGAIDAREPFQQFPVNVKQRDGSYKTVAVTSLRKLRQIERDTERAAANGEGEALRFRSWSQDDSNVGVNSFGPMTPPPLDPAVKAKYGLRSGTIKTVDAPDVTLGPGVSEANVSALVSE